MSLANGQTTVPANQSVVLQFNRFLNPATVTRQTVRLVNASGNALGNPVVDYDPVLLQVTLSQESPTVTWLMEGQIYAVNVLATTNAGDDGSAAVSGIEAIDRATLAATTKIEFKASAPVGAAPIEPTMHFCVDVYWPIFSGLGCGTIPGCHAAPSAGDPDAGIPPSPAEGLVLADSDWVKNTAVGRNSHESNVGALARPSVPGTIFGIDMPIIDRGTGGVGDPGNSWMMYKVLLGAPAAPGTVAGYSCPNNSFTTDVSLARAARTVITPDERARLSNYVTGREMPYPVDPSVPESQGGGALMISDMERLRLWIKQGAQFDDVSKLPDGGTTCALCGPVEAGAEPMEAGRKEAGPKEGGPKEGGAKEGGPGDATPDGTPDGGASG